MSNGEIILSTAEDGRDRIQLRAIDGSVWLSQTEMAELFQTTIPNINIHIKNILEEEELSPDSVINGCYAKIAKHHKAPITHSLSE